MKMIAVVNDHTMQIVYVLRGYEDGFEGKIVVDNIIQAGIHGEDAIAIFGRRRHFLNGQHYSFISEEDGE
jgi:hypothetical protein|nr:MAG TPA: hypothetical protein [Caudoviricetes sp.]